MRVFLSSALGLSLSWGAPAPPPSTPPADEAAPISKAEIDAEVLADAVALWGEGKYTEARKLLEPLASAEPITDRLVREKLLTHLADATINDPALPEDERRELAAGYINRLMDADVTWRMPPSFFSYELFSLYLDLRMERAEKAGEVCGANLVACESSVDNKENEIRRLQKDYKALEKDHAEQEVEVVDRVARSRAFALIPFGVGHFYNGDRILGGSFLAAEAAFGITGLTLLLYRTVADRCVRTNGFQEASLVCDPRNENKSQETIAKQRKAEEAMAWLFLGTVVLDIVVAQIRFRPYETRSVRRIKRKDLEKKGAEPPPPASPRSKRTPRAKVQASPTFSPVGGGMSVDVRF